MSSPRVIVVDWVPDERDMYIEGLEAAGFAVDACPPIRALAAVQRRRADAVIARITQPQYTLDGIELTHRIKAHPRTSHVPVVLLTSRIEPQYRAAALEARCDAFVLLPATPSQVARTLRRVIGAESSAPARRPPATDGSRARRP